jgi:hypothetical protein
VLPQRSKKRVVDDTWQSDEIEEIEDCFEPKLTPSQEHFIQKTKAKRQPPKKKKP